MPTFDLQFWTFPDMMEIVNSVFLYNVRLWKLVCLSFLEDKNFITIIICDVTFCFYLASSTFTDWHLIIFQIQNIFIATLRALSNPDSKAVTPKLAVWRNDPSKCNLHNKNLKYVLKSSLFSRKLRIWIWNLRNSKVKSEIQRT